MNSKNQKTHIERSRDKILRAIGRPRDVTFIRTPGNIGDHLIHAGTRQLLASLPFREVALQDVEQCAGDTALLGGGGAWCGPFQSLPRNLTQIEERFERVIILPSSFDTAIPIVRETLERTRATIFAREKVSFEMVRDICDADLAHDCAFYFDYQPYVREGSGVLTAFRTDQESAFSAVPKNNNDISATCNDLEDWLQTIARYSLVRTDRAHVTIGAAMLGKKVEYLGSSYHKVPAIVDFSLAGFPITKLPPDWLAVEKIDDTHLTDAEHIRRIIAGVTGLMSTGSKFLFVDNDQLGNFSFNGLVRIPFLERDGRYWGPPGDDQHAIDELDRMRREGAKFIVFSWVAFWWLEHYVGFHRHLRDNHHCLHEDETMVVFDLRRDNRSAPQGRD